MIAAEGLGRKFGSRWIFRNLDFEVATGQCLAVLGRNGSGKSTLLKVLSGLLGPTEGAVSGPEGDPRRALGYAAIDLALYAALTGREHLELCAKLRGCSARADELLGRVELSRAADQAVGRYSSGMRVRLKLALALQPDPAVLMLDEPTAALDAEGREIVAQAVTEQLGRGAVILATNDPEDRRLATHELALGG